MKYQVLNNYHMIEKSKSLVQLDQYAEYGEAQYILLDIYMSQINARDKGTKVVRFPKKDFEEYKEVKRVKPAALDKELQALMIAVKLPDPDDEKSFRIKPLFKECRCEKEEDGQYWITMVCEEEMNDYFFDISKIGYIKYRLGMMRSLSLNARLLYNELHANKHIKPYGISLDKLRRIMKLTTKNFKETKEFLRKLKECVNEINEKTNLLVSYEKINDSNHKVVGINFVTNIDEKQVDEDLAMYIAGLLNVNYEKAVPVAKAAKENKLDDVSIKERIDYLLTKTNPKNVIGYAIRIMDNDLWNKIKLSKSVNNEGDTTSEAKPKNEKLRELEEYYYEN